MGLRMNGDYLTSSVANNNLTKQFRETLIRMISKLDRESPKAGLKMKIVMKNV